MKKNKKGILGSFMVTFVAILIIAVLLSMFIFMASSIKGSSKQIAGEVIFEEDSLGIDDGVGYMKNYQKLVEAESMTNEYLSLDEALEEVGYDKK